MLPRWSVTYLLTFALCGCTSLSPGVGSAWRVDDPPQLSPYARVTSTPAAPQVEAARPLVPEPVEPPSLVAVPPRSQPLPATPSPRVPQSESAPLSGPIILPQQVTVPAHFELTVKGPERKQLGSAATFAVTVRNAGDEPAENVVIESEFDDAFVFPGMDEKRVRQSLGSLQPGEMKDLPLSLTSEQLGLHCCRFTVTGEGTDAAVREACVEFVPRQIEIRIEGPQTAAVRDRVEFRIRIANRGRDPLTAVQVAVLHDGAVLPREASAGVRQRTRSLQWAVPRIEPGEGVALELVLECRAAAEQSCLTVLVVSAETPAEEAEACLSIAAPGLRPAAR